MKTTQSVLIVLAVLGFSTLLPGRVLASVTLYSQTATTSSMAGTNGNCNGPYQGLGIGLSGYIESVHVPMLIQATATTSTQLLMAHVDRYRLQISPSTYREHL